MGAHGLVVGIASHGSVVMSRGWPLVTVEGPGDPRRPSSIQHMQLLIIIFFLSSLLNFRISIMQFFNYVMRKGKIDKANLY